MIFIAWQIRLTRTSVHATQSAVDVARDEFLHGQLLRVDAQRAAIDAEMPRLTLEVEWQATGVYRPDLMQPDRYGGDPYPTEAPRGTVFSMPQDAEVPLQVGCNIVVSNDGPRRARLRVDEGGESDEDVIAVGATLRVHVRRIQTLREWIEIVCLRAAGEVEHATIATFTYIYPGDVGATETHEVVQAGTITEPVPGSTTQWRIADLNVSAEQPFGALRAVVQPFQRIYWASRAESRRLADPVSAEAPALK